MIVEPAKPVLGNLGTDSLDRLKMRSHGIEKLLVRLIEVSSLI